MLADTDRDEDTTMFARKRADMRTIKALLTRAEDIARALGDREPAAEHLLLSALELPDGTARRAFERVGVQPDDVAGAVQRQYDEALAAVGIVAPGATTEPRPLPGRRPALAGFAPSGRAAFQAAATRARGRRPPRLTAADVVAAVCEQERGTAARALAVLGVDRDDLRAAAEREALAAIAA